MDKQAQVLQKKAEQAKNEAIKRSARLKKVALSEYSGWKDYIKLLDNYCETMMHNKAITNLSVVTPETLAMLKIYDRDIWLIKNVIKDMPMRFVNKLEEALKKDKGKEDAKVVT